MFPVALSRASGGQIRRILIVALATLLLIGVTAIVPNAPGTSEARAAAWVGNSLKKHEVWDPAPATSDWVPGHPKGYTEGETAAFRVTIEASAGEQLMFHTCLDFDDSAAYAFTDIDPWNSSHTGMAPPPAIGDLTGEVAPGFNGAGLTINSATSLGEGGGLCPTNYLGWEVIFTMTATGTAYVVYGGHIAAPGDPLPGGGTVPDGQGAASTSGVFQARVETDGGGDKTVNFSPDDITPLVPGIDIEKATNGVDADTPTGPMIPAGNTVTWTYVVTNTGQTDLTGITVTDSDIGPISCPVDTLAPGASTTCTATGVATAGQYANEGTATGTDPLGATHDDTDPSHYYGTVTGGIDIEKATNGVDADTPTGPMIPAGNTVTWTYVVTNTTNVDLTGITVTDSDIGPISCPVDTLAPGASTTCTATGVATAGQYANEGTATGTDPLGATHDDTDPSHYYGTVTGGIDIEKATNGVDADTPTGPMIPAGNTVTWTYVVTNTTNVDLTGITVTDSDIGPISCPVDTLAPGASTTCTATGVATAGQYANEGTATGTDPLGATHDDTDPSHYYGTVTGGIDIEKATNGVDADTPTGPMIPAGNTVTWTYVVTNTTNVDLTGITVTDSDIGPISCPVDTLAPGASTTCTATGVATAGQYANEGTATGTDPLGATHDDTDPSHYYGTVTGGIDIEKATNGVDADTPTGPMIPAGNTVTWTYVVTNTTNVDLTGITVTDSDIGPISCPVDTLAPGASTTCTATGVATAGQYANEGTATGTDPLGATHDDTDPSHYYGVNSGIEIEKYTNGVDADTPTGPMIPAGNTVEWTYLVQNTGNVALSSVVVDDNIPGVDPVYSAGDTNSNNKLDPGEIWVYHATGVAIAGQYANEGTVSGIDPLGTQSDMDPSHYYGVEGELTLEKATNGVDADTPTGPMIPAGNTVTWTYVVTNGSNAPVSDIAVTDSDIGPISCPVDTLAPGASTTCTATGVATAGQYANEGTVSGIDAADNPVGDTDPSHYYGVNSGIEIEKYTNGVDADTPTGPMIPAGNTVEWTYLVQNTGNVALSSVVVDDNIPGVDPVYSAGDTNSNNKLDPGEIWVYHATGVAIAGQYANEGTVSGIDPLGTQSDMDPSHYYGVEGELTLEKATNGVDADTPTGPMIPAGNTVTWTYVVTNGSNAPVSDIAVTDSDIGPISCPVDTLAPGASTTCTATGVATAGQYANEGTVSGIDAADNPVAATDPSHYFGVDSSIGLIKTGAFGLGDDGLANPGDTITYEFEVTNTGNVALTDIDVEDLDLGQDAVTCPNSSLVVGESMTCTAEYLVTQSDITTGSVNNCAAASGLDPIEDSVTDEDCFETVIGQSPSIAVVKGVEPGIIPVGEATEVTWTIAVTNTGNVPLSDVAITDALVATCDLTIGDLAVAASTTQTCTSTHTPDSLGWAFTNVAVATGVGPDGTTVTANDDADLAPIEVLGTAQLGDTVWLDTNKNGIQDSGEPGINGARVVLTNAAGTVVGTATTAKGPWDGWYKFVGLDAGRYTATLDTTSVSGALTTAGAFTIDLAEGQEYLLADFGVAETLPKTGTDSGILTWLGIGLLMIGGLAIVATRRRRFDQE